MVTRITKGIIQKGRIITKKLKKIKKKISGEINKWRYSFISTGSVGL